MYDFLILGQGLAGSLLAWQLLQKKKRVLVIDDGHASSSSRVAAGLINPLAGMRFNAATETPAWLAAVQADYGAIAEHLQTAPYLHPLPMQRLLRSPEQRRFLQRQRANPAVAEYLGPELAPDQVDPGIRAAWGGFEQQATAYLELPRLLDDLRNWLQAQQGYANETFEYADIVLHADHASLREHRARQLVFCEGYRMRDNPWFGQLPLQPDKGELLRLRSRRTLCRHIINGAHWLIPLADGSYRFGSTHEHHQIDGQPTPAGREELLAGLEALLGDSDGIDLIEHAAGVRPATSDRQPLIGTHAARRRLHLFNGFGARGALTIPWYSQRMSTYLLQGQALPPNADIARYA